MLVQPKYGGGCWGSAGVPLAAATTLHRLYNNNSSATPIQLSDMAAHASADTGPAGDMLDLSFVTEWSDDEGIGSDDSMETGHREGSEGGDTVTADGEAGRNHDSGNSGSGGDKTFRSQIKRSKSLVAIAQFRSRLLQHISRRFQDDGGGGGEQAASGESRIDVFGLDLSEICAKTGTEVPDIVTFCIQKIEKLGITDGIYRISGQHQQESNLDNLFSPEKTLTLKFLFET